MCAAAFLSVRARVSQGLRTLRKLARRGAGSHPAEPRRRRAVLLQVDGLSSKRLRAAMARGEMPHLKRFVDRGLVRLRSLVSTTAPSTPVFQAGLLYGGHAELPGFGWYDRELGRIVRMDLADDVLALEARLRSDRPPLLDGGVSYGTIWPGGAAEAFFNVALFIYGSGDERAVARSRTRNVFDRAVSTINGARIAARVASRFLLELGVGLYDFVRWCRRIRSTRFEWRFLYMRLFVSVVMREMATHGALLDVLRGVPLIYIDYLGYDEYAHRRGPDSELALYNLRGIDDGIHRIVRATRAVPEYGYDVYIFSDHGQSATTPFERIVGRDLHAFVLEHAARTAVRKPVETSVIQELVELKASELFVRTLWRPLRAPARLYVAWLRRRLRARVDEEVRRPLGAIEVVTGGTIAHLYFGRRREKLTVEEIAQRWPQLLDALVRCQAVGLVVGKGARETIVFHRGRRYALSDRARLSRLLPFRAVGYEVLVCHLEDAARGQRSGDLVLYGAFAEAGEVAFDFEFGSHGGIAPEELDQFIAYPADVELPFDGAVAAEEFHRFFRARYGRNAEEADAA
jgi:hypothetical protein